jgi:ABC-type transport system substrate-binding protein
LVGYCNPEVDKLIEQQSIEADAGRRKQLVWAIERKLAEDGARPIIFYNRYGTCWQPYVKGLTIMVNSLTTAIAWKTSGSTSRATSGCLSAARALSDIHPCKQTPEVQRSVA